MRQRIRFACVLFSGCLLLGIQSAGAATTYSYFYIAAQNNYTNVTPGSTMNVPLYLQEVNSDGSANSLLANEDGLFAAGASVNVFNSSGGTPTIITAILPNAGTPTTGFDDIVDHSNSAGFAALLEQLSFSDADGVAGVAQGSGISTVFLGTLSIKASSTPNQTTVFTVGAYDPANGNTVTFTSGYDLDNNADALNPADASSLYSSAASTNFTVTTSVPEPTALCLFAISGLVFARRARRLRTQDA